MGNKIVLERICIFHRRFMQNQSAVIKIVDVTQIECDKICKELSDDSLKRLKFSRFIDHKSMELKREYRRIYDVGKKKVEKNRLVDKKRSFAQLDETNHSSKKSE